uniref:E3 ubiquitin-protein ligase MYCBP2 n=3 Tax=Homininae TaxID=207598 RepID=UPI000D1D1444|nr:Chain A, E3 ubiquitin-protein ligase MYCBP2 [Homo sapiens]
SATSLKQDADDMCMICFTEALSAAPAIQLDCSHIFHLQCCRRVLENRWLGPRITFGFISCPICKNKINHIVLKDLLDPIKELYEDVRRKALMRLEYEGLHKSEAITTPGVRFYNDPAGYAMNRYAYYVCYKCRKAYFGGEARCDAEAGRGDDYDPRELICGACSDVSRAQMCPKHGTDFLEYKCRYCCSVAVFFCFGTTHFCNACHDDFQRMTSIPKEELPHCPAGPKGKQLEGTECPLHVVHPPTGEEFALGCGVCRNAHTF